MGTRLQGWLPQTATSAPEASPSPAGLLQACRPASGGPWELGQRQANHTHPEGPAHRHTYPAGYMSWSWGALSPGPGLMT